MGLRLYAEDILERVDVKVSLSEQPLELGVLRLEFTQQLGIRVTVLRSPLVERRIAEPALTANRP